MGQGHALDWGGELVGRRLVAWAAAEISRYLFQIIFGPDRIECF